MTLAILGERPTAQYCPDHGSMIVEVLVRGTTLKHDWLLSICPDCHAEAAPSDTPRYTPHTTNEGTSAQD